MMYIFWQFALLVVEVRVRIYGNLMCVCLRMPALIHSPFIFRLYTTWVNEISSIIVSTSLFLYGRESSKPNGLMHFKKETPQAKKPVSQPTIYVVCIVLYFFFRHKYLSSSFQFYFPSLPLSFLHFLLHRRTFAVVVMSWMSLKKIICLALTSMKSHIKYCNTRRHARAARKIKELQGDRESEAK